MTAIELMRRPAPMFWLFILTVAVMVLPHLRASTTWPIAILMAAIVVPHLQSSISWLTITKALAPREVWIVDFEFRQDPGERPLVWCMVAYEVFSKRELRYWRNDLINMRRAPFDTGPDVVIVSY